MLKSYVCNRYKYLKIGRDIHFEGGLFATESEDLQGLLESNDSFGVHIFPQDDPETLRKRAEEEERARMQGAFRSDESQDATARYADRIGMAEEDKQELIEDRKEAVIEAKQEKLKPKKRGRPKKQKTVDNYWSE